MPKTPEAPSIEDVLAQHGPMLSRIASSYERDRGKAQDLLQEISLALWKAIPRWRGQSSLRSYTAKVAHNRCVEHLGRECSRAEDPLVDEHVHPADGPVEEVDVGQRRQRLFCALAALPLGQRQALVLTLEGFTQAEIGEILQIDVNAVAQRISRARKHLRESMENENGR